MAETILELGADLALVQQRADDFLDYYHNQRPDLALAMKTPFEFISESDCAETLRVLDYFAGMAL